MLEEEVSFFAYPMGLEIPQEPHKLVCVAVFLALAGFSNWIALAYIHDFVGRIPLPDVVMMFIPEQDWSHRVGDLLVFLCSIVMLTVLALHKYRAIVARRVFFILGCLYWMRTISMLITQLPSAYADNEKKCRAQLKPEDRTWSVYWHRFLEQSVNIGVQDGEEKMLCGDLLFSGHTLVMVTCFLTVRYYIPQRWRLVAWLSRSMMYAGMVCMVLSRTHYTVDVIFAYWLSVGTFSIYHSFCEIETYMERKKSILSNIWLVKAVEGLEKNVVPGRLENQFSVPFLEAIISRWTSVRQLENSPSAIVNC